MCNDLAQHVAKTRAKPTFMRLHDHAKQYDDEDVRWMLHGNVSRNGYGNAIIGRHGGCFEEDIMRLMSERTYHLTGFGCTGEVCTNSRGEKGQCTAPKSLAKYGWVEVPRIEYSH